MREFRSGIRLSEVSEIVTQNITRSASVPTLTPAPVPVAVHWPLPLTGH